METSFHYALAEKQLGFKLREKVTTKFGFEVKAKGLFITDTGDLQYRATALKNFALSERVKDIGSTPLSLGGDWGPCDMELPSCHAWLSINDA